MTFEKDAVVLERNVCLQRVMLAVLAALVVVGLAPSIFIGSFPIALFFLFVPLGLHMRVGLENWRARPRSARVRAGEGARGRRRGRGRTGL